jgi:integrase
MSRLEKSKASKTTAKYWESKLIKRFYKGTSGEKVECPEYSVRMSYKNKQTALCTGTGQKALAAKIASEAYVFLQAHGWELFWEKYKIRKNGDESAFKDCCTIGEFLEKVQQKSSLKAGTFIEYRKSFCQILADIFKVVAGKEKFDYVNGGAQKRLDKIYKIKLSNVSSDKIEEWKNKTLRTRTSKDALRRNSSCATINKTLRNAKSLFSKKILKAIGMQDSCILPFKDIEFLPEGSHRYHSEFDAKQLVEEAMKELRPDNPEAFKIFLLALCCGLRRNEIDKLLWRQIDLPRGLINIQTTEVFNPKTRESCSCVDIDISVAEILAEYRNIATGKFVIESEVNPRPNAHYRHYRCDRTHKHLIEWLRSHGINSNNPLHTLRKEYGAEICRQFGLYKASRALRHSSYGVTEMFYVDKKSGVTPKFF